MDIALFIAQFFLIILIGVGINYIKKLPGRLHKEGEIRYEYGFKKDLEAIKASLTQENQLQTIRYQESQARMAEEYIEFIDYFNSVWTDRKVQKEIASNPKKQMEFNKKMVSLGIWLFIFGSDKTVKKYLGFRATSQPDASGNPHDVLIRFGELVLQMRRDLLHPDSTCSEDDFLNMFITDWENERKKLAARNTTEQ
ncbi:hypothetical protein DESC_710090 [Desulfosarcina cetonica]|uniref:hypothetical protein n=1 Tax=Desulfosarcina cetonica TaxID=90730 RepID=UPI0006D29EFF|nr:hypothetical protein [Desulfosarcina cetonica]VTR68594.1 hypothetical protein DESC_710090 [Desulfosarcina cetonica]